MNQTYPVLPVRDPEIQRRPELAEVSPHFESLVRMARFLPGLPLRSQKSIS